MYAEKCRQTVWTWQPSCGEQCPDCWICGVNQTEDLMAKSSNAGKEKGAFAIDVGMFWRRNCRFWWDSSFKTERFTFQSRRKSPLETVVKVKVKVGAFVQVYNAFFFMTLKQWSTLEWNVRRYSCWCVAVNLIMCVMKTEIWKYEPMCIYHCNHGKFCDV